MMGGNYNWGYPPGDVFVAKIGELFEAESPLAVVSAASFAPGGVPLASEVIAAGFGDGLAAGLALAPSTGNLPTTLGDRTLGVRDSLGTERPAQLWFVSPGQVNFLIPAGTANGLATFLLRDQTHTVASGTLQIDAVAPGIFTANASGQGVPAAQFLRFLQDGSNTSQDVFAAGGTPGTFVPRPIDLGPETDLIFLVLYTTGVRGRTALSAVTATIGGVASPVEYAGSVVGLLGLDQVNVRVPRSLAGRGQVDVVLTVDGKAANTVNVNIQ